MPVKFELENPFMRLWLLLHQTYNAISKCEDKVFSKHGISTEQHAVLIAIKHIDGPVTPTEVGQWLDRNTNSVSLIVERMVKAGLIRRVRDLRDRRSVRLVITSDGKELLDRSTFAGWELVQKILSRLSEEDMRTLIRLIETVREEAIEYLYPGETLKEIRRNESKNMASFMKRMSKYTSSPTSDTMQPSQETDGHSGNGIRKATRRVKRIKPGNNLTG